MPRPAWAWSKSLAKKTAVRFAESAVRDLQQLQAWYRDQGVPGAGQRIVTEILQRIDALPSHPDSGRIVPEFGQPFLRELIHTPFRIVYRREPDRVRIVRVWRSERLLKLPVDSK
jgi:plasmid stabilization system protein ParE